MRWCYLIGLVVVVFPIVLFSACGMESIDFENKELERNGPVLPLSFRTKGYCLLKSVTQIEEFVDLVETDWDLIKGRAFVNSGKWDIYKETTIEPFLQQYNETFFSNSNLLMIEYNTSNPIDEIKKMYVKNNELHVKLKYKYRFTDAALGVKKPFKSLHIPLKKTDFDGEIVHIQY